MEGATSELTAKNPRLTRTLSFRLVVIFTALLAVVSLVLTLLSATALSRFLLRNVDENLVSSGRVVAIDYLKQQVFPAPGHEVSAESFSLSDYYVYIDLEENWQEAVGTDVTLPLQMEHDVRSDLAETYGKPASVHVLENTLGTVPTTVPGTTGEEWRAIVLAVETPTTQETIGHVLIATPLGPRMDVISRVTRVMAGITVGTVLIGAIATFLLVRRSMVPLRRIERATHAIAAGDLSRRVPPGPEGSEVGMLSDSINVMLTQIEQAFDVKSESESKIRRFVSDASHELRTPLSTVRGYAELYRLGGVPEDKLGQTMDRVESEAVRMGGLVEDLLQLARLDEGRPLELTEVCLVDIAENAIADLQVRGDGRPSKVIGIDGEIPPCLAITADENKVTQVMANLLTNALTHTPEGTPVEIALGMSDDDSQAIVEVRDHGPGVPAEQREQIFERFFRTDISRSRASGGSGLGLSIVASVMAAHGGSAQALETPGGGLTVRLTFPVDGPVAPETSDANAANETSTR